MLVNREVLLAKVEVTYNTDPTPATSADEILVENLAWAPEGARMNERRPVRASIAALKQLYGGHLINLTFDTEIKGSGSLGVAPEIGPLFEGCGMAETISAGVSVAYAPVSTAIDSLTFWYYQDGTLIKVTGARGNMVINLEAGKQGMISWSFTGHLSTYTDVALATPSYSALSPYPVIGCAFTVASYSAIISKLTIDLSNQLATPPDVSATDGFGQVRITGRDTQGSFDPEAVVVATHAFNAIWMAGTAGAIAVPNIGIATNRYAIALPAVAYRNVSPADRDGVRTFEVPFGAAESAGDDDVTITFT